MTLTLEKVPALVTFSSTHEPPPQESGERGILPITIGLQLHPDHEETVIVPPLALKFMPPASE